MHRKVLYVCAWRAFVLFSVTCCVVFVLLCDACGCIQLVQASTWTKPATWNTASLLTCLQEWIACYVTSWGLRQLLVTLNELVVWLELFGIFESDICVLVKPINRSCSISENIYVFGRFIWKITCLCWLPRLKQSVLSVYSSAWHFSSACHALYDDQFW